MATRYSLISDYLRALQVPFTQDYTEGRFASMPFSSMFGLKKLLEEYGIESEGYLLKDKTEILKLSPPFLARTPDGYTIVEHVTPDTVRYLSQGVVESVPYDEFLRAWDGNVFLSFPAPDACEPDYRLHRRVEAIGHAKKWVLRGCVLALFLYAFFSSGIQKHLSAVLICFLDIAGLWFTYMLVQKSLNIHTRTADRVCGVLEKGGCDDILATKASKFFGLFGWSEVGFAYFSVSLLALLLFPSSLPWLAACNLCCLPFTLWSIWYQKFRAHRWCTLCVSVQTTLWLLFFCYLFGGWLRDALPLGMTFFVLGAAYLGVMLALNALMPLIEKPDPEN